MTRSNLYTVLCAMVRLAAVYLFVEAVAETATIIAGPRIAGETDLWPAAFAEPGVQFAIALLLWMFPGVLARIAAKRRSLENFESELAPDTLQYVAFSVLGIWFAISGISQLAYTLHRWIFLNGYLTHHLEDPTRDPKVLGTLLSEIAKIGLGIGLAFGARGLSGLLRRFRQSGLVPAVAEQATKGTEAS